MPRLRLVPRSLAAFLVALSLLFSQLALAGYVCPGASDAQVMADMMISGEPCEGMDAAQPVLCHQYASSSPQSVEQAKVATPSLPAVVQVLVVPVVVEATTSSGRHLGDASEARPSPNPVFLSTLRLRV